MIAKHQKWISHCLGVRWLWENCYLVEYLINSRIQQFSQEKARTQFMKHLMGQSTTKHLPNTPTKTIKSPYMSLCGLNDHSTTNEGKSWMTVSRLKSDEPFRVALSICAIVTSGSDCLLFFVVEFTLHCHDDSFEFTLTLVRNKIQWIKAQRVMKLTGPISQTFRGSDDIQNRKSQRLKHGIRQRKRIQFQEFRKDQDSVRREFNLSFFEYRHSHAFWTK
jgi:hypothetical protein